MRQLARELEWAERDEGDETPIDADSMRIGIALARWFVNEMYRVYAVLRESSDHRHLREFAEFVNQHGGQMSVREVQNSTEKYGSTADDVRELFKKAQDAGMGVVVHPETQGKPGRPGSEVFRTKAPTKPPGTDNGNVGS